LLPSNQHRCSGLGEKYLIFAEASTTFTVIMLAVDMQQFISFYNDYHILSR